MNFTEFESEKGNISDEESPCKFCHQQKNKHSKGMMHEYVSNKLKENWYTCPKKFCFACHLKFEEGENKHILFS